MRIKTTGETAPKIVIGIVEIIRIHIELAIIRIPVSIDDPRSRAPPLEKFFFFNFERRSFSKFIRTTLFVRKKNCSFTLMIFHSLSHNFSLYDSGKIKNLLRQTTAENFFQLIIRADG